MEFNMKPNPLFLKGPSFTKPKSNKDTAKEKKNSAASQKKIEFRAKLCESRNRTED